MKTAVWLIDLVSYRWNGWPLTDMLTGRQDEVLQLLGGHCDKSIARRPDIEVETVKAHVKEIGLTQTREILSIRSP